MQAESPRLVVSSSGSSSGKTLVSLLLLAWARARGLSPRAFKAGPDFLDCQYLSAASGSPAFNLDPWMMDRDACLASWARAGSGGLAVVEGAMGLYDGKKGRPFGSHSTATVAGWLDAPVVLVMDAS